MYVFIFKYNSWKFLLMISIKVRKYTIFLVQYAYKKSMVSKNRSINKYRGCFLEQYSLKKILLANVLKIFKILKQASKMVFFFWLLLINIKVLLTVIRKL